MTAKKSAITEKFNPELSRGGSALAPFDEMDRLFDNFFPASWPRMSRLSWPRWAGAMPQLEGKLPAVDVVDREEQIIVRAEIPGINKDDIEVSINGNMMSIRGSSRREEKKEEGEYYRREIYQGAFSRSLSLPAEVDSSKAKATFKDGVLEVSVPKLTPSKRRSIKVD